MCRIVQRDRKRAGAVYIHLKPKSVTRERRMGRIFVFASPVFQSRQTELLGNDFHQLPRAIKLRPVPILRAYRHYLPIEYSEIKGADARKPIPGRVVRKIESKRRISIIWGKFGAFQLLGAVGLFTLVRRKNSE